MTLEYQSLAWELADNGQRATKRSNDVVHEAPPSVRGG